VLASAFASCGHAAAWPWTEMGQNLPPAVQKCEAMVVSSPPRFLRQLAVLDRG